MLIAVRAIYLPADKFYLKGFPVKLIKKALIGLVTAAAFAGSVQASVINVGGVFFDPDSLLDFSGTTATLTQSISSTGVLSGFGVITALNGTGVATFCPGCELTLQYGGFTPIGSVLIPVPITGTAINYSGGFLNIFVDSSPDVANPFDPLSLIATNTGGGPGDVLWAGLLGHAVSGVTLFGTAAFSPLSSLPLLTGSSLFDIVGGLALGNLNTNSQIDGADIAVTTSFSNFPKHPTTRSISFATGSGNFTGNSIPEPGSIALIGLGLLGAAFVRRRKSA